MVIEIIITREPSNGKDSRDAKLIISLADQTKIDLKQAGINVINFSAHIKMEPNSGKGLSDYAKQAIQEMLGLDDLNMIRNKGIRSVFWRESFDI